jgi:hypothetical protein
MGWVRTCTLATKQYQDTERHIFNCSAIFLSYVDDEAVSQMFGMSKIVAERSAAAKEAEVESALPLQTSVSQ